MKTFRLVLAMLLILASLWVIVGEQMAGVSANATINAPVVTIRAATAGRLSLTNRPFGARIRKGETLASVEDPLVDGVRLDDLRLETDLAAAQVERLTADLAATETLRADLRAREEVFAVHRLEEIRVRLDHARRRLAAFESGDWTAWDEGRALELVGVTSDRVPGAPATESLALDHARERVATLEIALEAAEAGVFLGDGYNDAPASGQRAAELDGAVAGLRTALDEARARRTALAARGDRERVRVNGLTGGTIPSPVDGLFWEILQGDGVTVQRGDPILRVVDCGASIVTLSVTERVYGGLRVGQPATFRLNGGERIYDGTVARLAGSGAATIYEHLAVAPGRRHLERFDVTLLMPGLTADPDRGCAVGRTGRAFFDGRPLDRLRAWLD